MNTGTNEYITLPERAEVCSIAGLQELLVWPLKGEGESHCKVVQYTNITLGFNKP